jgi:hypothetical protein
MAEATPRSARQGIMLSIASTFRALEMEINANLVQSDPHEYTRISWELRPEMYSGVGTG